MLELPFEEEVAVLSLVDKGCWFENCTPGSVVRLQFWMLHLRE
jgi:hypothetical protein